MRLKLHKDKWESGILRANCYKLDNILSEYYHCSQSAMGSLILNIINHLAPVKKPVLISCRVTEGDLPLIKALLGARFNIIERYVAYKHDLKEYNGKNQPASVRTFKKSDIKDVKNIARTSFSFDRFHKDPNIKKELADKTREKWAENSAEDKNHYILVSTINKSISGFIIVKKGRASKEDSIQLIAVKKEFRGRGIGSDLIMSALTHSKSKGAYSMQVGTQADNSASVSLYKKCGFRIFKNKLTFHKWIK